MRCCMSFWKFLCACDLPCQDPVLWRCLWAQGKRSAESPLNTRPETDQWDVERCIAADQMEWYSLKQEAPRNTHAFEITAAAVCSKHARPTVKTERFVSMQSRAAIKLLRRLVCFKHDEKQVLQASCIRKTWGVMRDRMESLSNESLHSFGILGELMSSACSKHGVIAPTEILLWFIKSSCAILPAFFLPAGSTLTRRFGVFQKGKMRPIHDHKASLVNSSVTQMETVTVHGVDHIACLSVRVERLLKAVASARPSSSNTVAARLGKTKHACNHWLWKSSTEIRRPFLRTTCAKTIFDLKRLLLPNAWQPRERKPRTTMFNNQQPSKKKCSRLVPKMSPKMGPQRGTKIGTELGACFLFLINRAQNWAPKWGPKMNPKTGPQNESRTGPKSSPKNEFKHKQWSATMSNCPVSHVRTHTQKQTAAWILSKLLDTSCLRALTRNKPHVQLLETSVSTTPEECPCSPENPWFLGPQTRNLDWRTCPSYYITETRRSAAHLWLSNPHVRAHLRPSQLILRPFKVTSTTF